MVELFRRYKFGGDFYFSFCYGCYYFFDVYELV